MSKFQRKEEEFNNEDRGRLGGVLGRQLESASHDGRYDFKSDLTHTNKNGSVGHFKVGRVDGQLFHDIFEVVRTYLPHGELVDLHDDYSNAKCFITDDGLCGFAVEPDGNLVSVFSLSPDTNKGFLYAIKDLVRAEGATHLDAYGSKHQDLEEIYAKTLGFHTASTMDYNMEYDHDGIAENHGNPNVVFMVDHEVAQPKHFDKDSYDAAQQYQFEQVSKHGLVSQLTTHLKSMGIEVHGKKDMEEFLKNHDPQELQKMEEQREMEEIKQKAIADGTFMKAPNGKKSNLTEKQWLQTRTKNFKNWFGDWQNDPENASKVVDENGEPLVVYHGGVKNISSFLTYHKDKEVGDMYGAYFSKDKKYAESYGNTTLYEVFLNIRNPLITEGPWTGVINEDQATDILTEKYDGIINDKYDLGIMYKLHLAKSRSEIIIFNPNQVKSATDNNGNFSTTDDRIQAAWSKKEEKRTIFNKDLLPSEKNAIQHFIETLSSDTDTSRGLYFYNEDTKQVYKFDTSLNQYKENRLDGGDGFEIKDILETNKLDKEHLEEIEDGFKENKTNFDSWLKDAGYEKRTSNGRHELVKNGRTVDNHDGLDSNSLSRESDRGQSDTSGQKHQQWSEVKRDSATGRISFVEGDGRTVDGIAKFQTPQGELYGFVDKDGKMYLDETVISPEHPIHEYTHLWNRAVRKKNPELWNRCCLCGH